MTRTRDHVSDKPGRGTTFRIVLPPASTVQNDLAAPASRPQTPKACAAVLVVDDEPAIGAVLRRILREHEVTVVLEAKKALELIESGKRFDIILCDLMMPEMTGMDFFDELARRFPQAARRVVFVSAGAFTPSARAFLDRVTNARIDKPFDTQMIRGLVGRSCLSSDDRVRLPRGTAQ